MAEKMIVFFDGDCLMCKGTISLLNRLDAKDRLLFAPLGGKTADQCEIDDQEDSVAVVANGRTWRSSEAARLVFAEVGGVGLLVAALLSVIPLKAREWGYALIARNRKRFVQTEACRIPEEGMREKMRP